MRNLALARRYQAEKVVLEIEGDLGLQNLCVGNEFLAQRSDFADTNLVCALPLRNRDFLRLK